MLDFLIWLFWTLSLGAVALTLAYRRVDLRMSTATMGLALLAYFALAGAHWLWIAVLVALWAGLAALNIGDLRREQVTAPLLRFYKTLMPHLSTTEREALEAGTVWWDGELFTGLPDWSKLAALPPPRLSDEERAFLDGPTEELCRRLDDWEITHELGDMPREIWQYIIEKRFFAMIIPKRYGGLEFSPLGVSAVLAKLSSRSAVAASTIGVPNSLGPGELLLHYGTDEQKEHYLPRLARGEEIPCFALTSPRVGSDASSIYDTGVVCRGTFNGQETIGIRLNWDKRYITLAPIATVLGLAFKLYDPEHLIGDKDEYGITAALIPTHLPGIEIGRRHFPINIPFQNGPTQGRDVFVPVDSIIGGRARAGQGWKMLVEQLSAGRGVTLPSNAMGGGRAAVHATGAYARIRRQFNLPIAQFEGVGEALARIAGYTYIINAGVTVTCTVLGRGEKPSVPSASQISLHRACPEDRNRRDGRARRQGHHARAEKLPRPQLRGAAGGDHRRGREHSHPQPHHLRPGRGALPSLRAEGDGGRPGPGFRARAQQFRPAPLRPHRLRHQQCRPLVLAGAHERALQQRPGERPHGALLPAHQPL